ncbi:MULTISPECIES: GNAT family N-acetyltransferase [unclassified Pseudoalteromonas]|uniref:GNAT family N-acetyltransferase n=1 Tax=unclassified Pseudoalteromonas TaxID=194690 RepID=UPI001F3C530C|nr:MULTISPECIES: GNAT family protein [unclassified Pseudoalteromonas]MCF2825594.1 GNAT family N-acetyltransferase [Pseudoalteromonas sp. OF5H-5]MCF2833341.1 GNAT family N-acetyltransferase [Pseudoalteromonas sp. DL2-H6]MCF2923027.1 GNAT family N-acetyltransferase [Pseudoalteromonas sp. DL2-H1]
MWPTNKPLIGHHVTLEPLSTTHVNALQQAVKDGEAWKLWYANVPNPDDMERYVNTAISQASEGNLAYVVRLNSSNEIVGTTRYYNADIANRRAMLGYTWYSDKVRRTAVNTECKFLLLQQLFEDFDAIAVEFRTHFFNHASRNAIERLGAKLDGILRSHQIGRNGELRDTVVYSIIASEWPTVKQHLLSKLDR